MNDILVIPGLDYIERVIKASVLESETQRHSDGSAYGRITKAMRTRRDFAKAMMSTINEHPIPIPFHVRSGGVVR